MAGLAVLMQSQSTRSAAFSFLLAYVVVCWRLLVYVRGLPYSPAYPLASWCLCVSLLISMPLSVSPSAGSSVSLCVSVHISEYLCIYLCLRILQCFPVSGTASLCLFLCSVSLLLYLSLCISLLVSFSLWIFLCMSLGVSLYPCMYLYVSRHKSLQVSYFVPPYCSCIALNFLVCFVSSLFFSVYLYSF